MLTKIDLSQIQKVVRKTVQDETPKIVQRELRGFATKEDLGKFATKKDLGKFATKEDLKNELKPIKKDIRKIQKGLKKTSDFLDKENLKTLKNSSSLAKDINSGRFGWI